MEEIIGTRSGEESSCSSIEPELPKLRSLYLTELPKLKSICSAELICDSLQQIERTNCQMLKRLAIHLLLLEN
jgi:disease resistance protein RPS2